MRVAALVLAVSAAVSWGVGAVLLKRSADVFAATTLLVFQYALGLALIGSWVAVTGGTGSLRETIGRHWVALAVIAALQIAGYAFFIIAIQHAGRNSAPTAVVTAIAAAYPALVAVLSGPFLGESLHWNHALGVALVVGGVVVAQVL